MRVSYFDGGITVLDHHIKEERLVEMEDQQNPCESDSVLGMKGLDFPVDVGEGILEESSNVLECSPLLGHISGLPG